MIGDSKVWFCNQFYNRVMGTLLPVRWFAPSAPETEKLNVAEGRLTIQIVSHCWQYAHLSRFQLSSLLNYPPQNCDVTYTLFYASEDSAMCDLIAQFAQLKVPNVSWDWQVLPREELFRRAIGRHRASLASQADWLWFADCDLIFHEGCLDSLAASLSGIRQPLVFPDHEGITDLLPPEHPMLNQHGEKGESVVDVDTRLFHRNNISKAKGAFQVVHGDVARQVGYCGTLALYQQPSDVWRKTYEDTVFRRLIESEGVPVAVNGLYRIRHAEKGRYRKGTRVSRLRSAIRKLFG